MAEFKHLIRIANTDLHGNKAVVYALKNVRGVGVILANAVCRVANVDGMSKLGNLSDDNIKKIDEIIKNLGNHGIPSWMFNRRKNYEDGKDSHILTGNLSFAEENDVKRMKKIRSYRGVRHGLGLPVRGQRTKSNFRKNKGKASLGVVKKDAPKPKEEKT